MSENKNKPQKINIDAINEDSDDLIKKFNKNVDDGKHIFLFLFLDGCGPCIDTKEKWKDVLDEDIILNNTKYSDNNDIVLAQINQELFEKLENVGLKPSKGFPCLRYIKKGKGNGKSFVQDYEDSGISPNERSPHAFAKWIISKVDNEKESMQQGGSKTKKNRKLKRSRKSKIIRKSRKSKKNKKNKKTRKNKK